jgi:hypothetical protein
MWTDLLRAEYIGLLIGAFGIGWGLGYMVRAVERVFDML